MAEKQYALSEDGYIRCANCEEKQPRVGEFRHTPECDGGNLLAPVNREKITGVVGKESEGWG